MRNRIVIYVVFFIGLALFVEGMSRILRARQLIPAISFNYLVGSEAGIHALIGAGLLIVAAIFWWRQRKAGK